jgi:hypothetical protein
MAMPTCRSCSPRRRRRGSSLKPAGVRRFDVMCNDFIPVGRTTDPAELTGGHDVVAAFRRIGETGAALNPAAAMGAYALADRGTRRACKIVWRATVACSTSKGEARPGVHRRDDLARGTGCRRQLTELTANSCSSPIPRRMSGPRFAAARDIGLGARQAPTGWPGARQPWGCASPSRSRATAGSRPVSVGSPGAGAGARRGRTDAEQGAQSPVQDPRRGLGPDKGGQSR